MDMHVEMSLDRSVELMSTTTTAAPTAEIASKMVSLESSRVCTIDELALIAPSSSASESTASTLINTTNDVPN